MASNNPKKLNKQFKEKQLKEDLEQISVEFLAWLMKVEISQIASFVAIGMPRHMDKTFSWPDVSHWLKFEGKSIMRSAWKRSVIPAGEDGKPASGEVGTYNDIDEKYKALSRKQKYELAAGLLIYKSDADKDYMRVVLGIRSSLLALPEQIAPQLADLNAREAAAVLRERLVWICSQHREGRVTITDEMVADVDALIAKHATSLNQMATRAVEEPDDG